MAVGLTTDKNPGELVAFVLPLVESHLQMMWVQTEWVTPAAVARIDVVLHGFVTELLGRSDDVSTMDVVTALREGLERYFVRSIESGEFVDDPLVRPIVERFGASLFDREDASVASPSCASGDRVDAAYNGIDSLLTGFALRPQTVNQEAYRQLHSYLYEVVENADDELVVRTYLRDRLYNLRETLRCSSHGGSGAIAALDRLLDDPILIG